MFSISRVFSRHMSSQYKCLLTKTVGKDNNIGYIQMNRPKALNALCDEMMGEIDDCLTQYNNDEQIKCIILTGNEKAFAAGADISEMLERTYSGSYNQNKFDNWSSIHNCRLPIIAAVQGYALGGGCEVAMSCDMIYASESAKFGQPEIKLGTIPGGGGTQNLIRAVGKFKAMEMILTGNVITAQEAKNWGLVCDVLPNDKIVEEVIKIAEKIASYSRISTMLCKDAVKSAQEMTLSQGLVYERRLFWSTFALNDRKEGMTAFLEKRSPNFTNN